MISREGGAGGGATDEKAVKPLAGVTRYTCVLRVSLTSCYMFKEMSALFPAISVATLNTFISVKSAHLQLSLWWQNCVFLLDPNRHFKAIYYPSTASSGFCAHTYPKTATKVNVKLLNVHGLPTQQCITLFTSVRRIHQPVSEYH